MNHLLGVNMRNTSADAADSISPLANRLRTMVYGIIRNRRGATDEEIQLALRLNPSTSRPRRVELERAGIVKDSGRRRANRSGRKAIVWVAA